MSRTYEIEVTTRDHPDAWEFILAPGIDHTHLPSVLAYADRLVKCEGDVLEAMVSRKVVVGQFKRVVPKDLTPPPAEVCPTCEIIHEDGRMHPRDPDPAP